MRHTPFNLAESSPSLIYLPLVSLRTERYNFAIRANNNV